MQQSTSFCDTWIENNWNKTDRIEEERIIIILRQVIIIPTTKSTNKKFSE